LLNKNLFSPNNFLALPEKLSKFEYSNFVLLPIPYEESTTFVKGTKYGPNALICASQELELFDCELGFEPCEKGICTLDELEPISSNPEKMTKRIEDVAENLLEKKKIILSIGGEHTITVGLIKAFKKKYQNLSVLQLDAHADLRDSYQGSKYSHACVMRRISEFCPYVGVGIRSISTDELSFAKEKKIKLFFAHKIKDNFSFFDEVLKLLSEDVYLSFDLDFLDPSIMPSVGTPEPGGIGWYETLYLLKRLAQTKNVVGLDITELSPIPGNIAPNFLAAKLVYKMIGYIISGKKSKE